MALTMTGAGYRGVPAADTSARVLPGAAALTEDNTVINGVIATCVEAATAVVLNLTQGVSLTTGNLTALYQNMLGKGLASPGGYSNWANASAELQQLGVPNTPYGNEWFGAHPAAAWQSLVSGSLAQGRPVLFGLSQASQLRDTWSGQLVD